MFSQTGARRRNPGAMCKGQKDVLTGDIVNCDGERRWCGSMVTGERCYPTLVLVYRRATGSTIALITRLFTSQMKSVSTLCIRAEHPSSL